MIYRVIKSDYEKCPVGSYEIIFESEDRNAAELFAKSNSRLTPLTVYCKTTNIVLGGYGWEEEID